MGEVIQTQTWKHYTFYAVFGLASLFLLWYYLSDTIVHFTTDQQFPISSFERFPLTLLIFPAELFSILFGLYFIYTLFVDRFRNKEPKPLEHADKIPVAILLPVYNEPKDVVERTIKACLQVRWKGGKKIYLLDDSTTDHDKKNMDDLAKHYKLHIVRRPDRKGYKAGNVNNAIKNAVKEEFFLILDSDQAPEPEFFEHTMDHFSDEKVGFVQTPQHFINDGTPLERATKIGSDIFFSAMCVGKAHDGAMPFCGTNVIVRRKAFMEVNGFSYYTSTEDIELGIRINEAGYVGAYVPEVLVHGFAPHDYSAYAIQQYRWANGNLAILRESWLKILAGNFSLRYQIHMFFTLGWWFIGFVTLAYILVPIISLLTGLGTHHAWLPTALVILLYFNVVLGVGMIYVSLQGRNRKDPVTVKDAVIQYSLITNSIFLFTQAAFSAMLKRYIGFKRTKKSKSDIAYSHVKWNLLLAAVCFGVSVYALFFATRAADVQALRTYLPLSLWLLFYSVVLASSIIFVGNSTQEGTAA